MKAATTVSTISPRRVLALFATAIALASVPSATLANTPILNLGPITVANGSAVVKGAVGTAAIGHQLTVNGQPLGIDASGQFAGQVNLNGASSIDLKLTDPAGGQQFGFSIPLTLTAPGGIIPAGVLDAIEQAGLNLLQPVTNGDAVAVAGGVLDKSHLASLSVNGKDVLRSLGPGGSFSVQLPGTTKTVTLSATDNHGVRESILSAVYTPLNATSVSAAAAVGVRIVKIRYLTKGVIRTHRVRMVVTVKDRQGRLIRGAKITVRGTKTGRFAARPKAKLSGSKGTATLTLRLRTSAFGKRLVTITSAKTPTAKAQKRSSVKVPRLKRTQSHR